MVFLSTRSQCRFNRRYDFLRFLIQISWFFLCYLLQEKSQFWWIQISPCLFGRLEGRSDTSFQSWTAPGRSVSWIVMGDPEIKNGGFWWENHGNILGNTVDIYVKYGKYSIFMYFFILGQWSINVDVPWCSTFDIPGGCSGHGIQILQSPPSGFCKWYSISGLSMLC